MIRNKIPEVKTVSNKITKCCIKADTETLFEHYDQSKEFKFIGSNGVKLNFNRFRRICNNYYGNVVRQRIDTISDEFKMLSENIAMEVWTGKIKGYLKSGGVILMENYTVTTMYNNMKGKWKVVFVQESALLPKHNAK